MTSGESYNGKIRFAVVGLGHIGRRHADIILSNPEAELAAVCDINSNHGNDWEGVPYFADLKDMIREADFDVLCITTPNGLHSEQALMALNEKKHVLIEKPMGLSKAQCEKVIFTALEKSRYVFCVMQNRYSPPSVWFKQLVDSGKLGKIHMVQVNCYWNRGQEYYLRSSWKGTRKLDGGVLYTQFSHFIDMIYWLFGDISVTKSHFHNFGHENVTEFEDSGSVSFAIVNGGMGIMNYSTAVWSKNFESSLTIIAEKGTIKVSGQYMDQVEYCDVEGYEMPELQATNPPNDYGDYKGSAANHEYVFNNVIETLRGKTTITTNALEGMKVVDIIERIYEQNPYLKS